MTPSICQRTELGRRRRSSKGASLGRATSAFRKPVLSPRANMAPRLRKSASNQSSVLKPRTVPVGVDRSRRVRSGPIGFSRYESRDSDQCSATYAAVRPFIIMVSSFVETMKIPPRRCTRRTPSTIWYAEAGLAALDDLDRGWMMS